MKKLISTMLIATSALTSFAEDAKDYYLQTNAGYAIGMKSTFTGKAGTSTSTSSKINSGKSASFGLEAGYVVNENFRFALNLDYMPSFSIKTNTSNLNDGEEQLYNNNSKVKSFNLMTNFFVDAGNFSGFKPYLVLGLGLSRNKTSNLNYAGDNSTILKGKNKNNFAWKLGLGTKYSVNDDFDIDIRYQYLDLGKASWGNSTDENSVTYSANNYKLRANQVSLGIAYKF